jgi:hypothetical protein
MHGLAGRLLHSAPADRGIGDPAGRGVSLLPARQHLDFCRKIADDISIMDRREIMHCCRAADDDLPAARGHPMP